MKGDFIMQDKDTSPGKTNSPEKNPLDEKTTYYISGGRSSLSRFSKRKARIPWAAFSFA